MKLNVWSLRTLLVKHAVQMLSRLKHGPYNLKPSMLQARNRKLQSKLQLFRGRPWEWLQSLQCLTFSKKSASRWLFSHTHSFWCFVPAFAWWACLHDDHKILGWRKVVPQAAGYLWAWSMPWCISPLTNTCLCSLKWGKIWVVQSQWWAALYRSICLSRPSLVCWPPAYLTTSAVAQWSCVASSFYLPLPSVAPRSIKLSGLSWRVCCKGWAWQLNPSSLPWPGTTSTTRRKGCGSLPLSRWLPMSASRWLHSLAVYVPKFWTGDLHFFPWQSFGSWWVCMHALAWWNAALTILIKSISRGCSGFWTHTLFACCWARALSWEPISSSMPTAATWQRSISEHPWWTHPWLWWALLWSVA